MIEGITLISMMQIIVSQIAKLIAWRIRDCSQIGLNSSITDSILVMSLGSLSVTLHLLTTCSA